MRTTKQYVEDVRQLAISKLMRDERYGAAAWMRSIPVHFDCVSTSIPDSGPWSWLFAGQPMGETFMNDHGSGGIVHVYAIAAEDGLRSLASTILHEMGHALAPLDAGHKLQWAISCKMLGLDILTDANGDWVRRDKAVFTPDMEKALWELEPPDDLAEVEHSREVANVTLRSMQQGL